MRVLLGKDVITPKRVYHVCLQFQPRDIWIGVYIENMIPVRLYVCIIPMLPVHIKIESRGV